MLCSCINSMSLAVSNILLMNHSKKKMENGSASTTAGQCDRCFFVTHVSIINGPSTVSCLTKPTFAKQTQDFGSFFTNLLLNYSDECDPQ